MFNIDIAIFVGFLAVNLAVGLYYGRNVKNIRDYALGGRNFSTGALVATIVATWVSGSGFFITLSKTYSDGLYYLIASSGMTISFIIVAVFFIPRMGSFLGKTSVAEAMGDLYGKEVRLITAVCGIIENIGGIAVQFKVFGNLFNYFLGIEGTYAIIIAAIVVVLYSAFGGIRAVTYTDVVQFITFGFVVPLIGIIVWNHTYDSGFTIAAALENSKFSWGNVVNFNNPKFWEMIPLMLYFIIPSIDSVDFQRISIGKNVAQVQKAFFISAFLFMVIKLVIAWIPFLIFNIDSTLQPTQIISYLVDNYTYTGLKGLVIVGIASMAMSTADSRINSSSVLFAHDINQVLKIKMGDLALSKIFSIIIGFVGIYLALSKNDLLSIVMTSASFYMPIITVPLLLAILGFRSTKKTILIGMAAGFITVVLWNIMDIEMDSIIPAIIINLTFLIGSHYLLNQEGGWRKDRDYKTPLNTNRQNLIIKSIKLASKFRFLAFCKKHAPTNEFTYMGLGIYCIFYTFTTMYSTQVELLKDNGKIILAIYQIMMITGVLLAMYPIWPLSIKQEIKQKIVQFSWHIVIFYMLTFFSSFFVMVSDFGQLQFVVFTINMVIAIVLVGWKIALAMILVGFYLSMQFYKFYSGLETIDFSIGSPQFIFMYSLMIVGTAIVIFFKPKQEHQELTEQKASHLGERIEEQDEELEKSFQLKNEFLRNLEHEAHTPITGITSMGQVLDESYDKLTEKQRRSAIKEIAKSSERLSSLVNNLIDLSKLSSLSYKINKKPVDLSNLVYDRLEYCKKLYLNSKELEFLVQVEENIMVNCDEHYMKTTLDNLIINAIQYSKEGTITLKLGTVDGAIEFAIADEGIGIPPLELKDVFRSFTVSSKTKTPAGGRGVGLALCEKTIKAHGGQIRAESDGVKGAKFVFVLPRKYS